MPAEITGLEEVLGYKTVTAMVTMFPYKPSAVVELFPERPIPGDIAQWDVLKGGRTIGEANVRGGKSKTQALQAVDQKTAQCIHLFDNKALPADTLNNLRAAGSKEKNARATVAREAEDLRSLHRRTREYYCAAALSGSIAIAQTDVIITVDYGFSGTHTPTAGTSWATASTDIVKNIKTWMDLVRQDSGLEPTRAYCNTTVMQYLLKNTAIQKFLGTNAYMEQVGKSGKITRLAGLDIHEVDKGYLSGGTFTKFIADDKFIITPEPGEFANLQVGTAGIPDDDGNLIEVAAPAAYVDVTKDPAAIKLLEHDVVLPVIYIPDAVVYADTTT